MTEQHTKVRKFIESKLIVFDDDVVFDDDDNIFTMGFVNSLFAMQLLEYIESEFELSVGQEHLDVKNFSSVNNIVALVEKINGANQ